LIHDTLSVLSYLKLTSLPQGKINTYFSRLTCLFGQVAYSVERRQERYKRMKNFNGVQ